MDGDGGRSEDDDGSVSDGTCNSSGGEGRGRLRGGRQGTVCWQHTFDPEPGWSWSAYDSPESLPGSKLGRHARRSCRRHSC